MGRNAMVRKRNSRGRAIELILKKKKKLQMKIIRNLVLTSDVGTKALGPSNADSGTGNPRS